MTETLLLKFNNSDLERIEEVIQTRKFLLEYPDILSELREVLKGTKKWIIDHDREYRVFEVLKELEISFDIDFAYE